MFITHYIQAYKRFGGSITQFDHPFLIEMAKKGVKATQFLYSVPFRPLFAGTAMGKMMTRFQLWAWNSVRFRNKVLREANIYGIDPTSQEYDRFKRLMISDMVSLALGSMFMYSLFGSQMPQPYAWFQDLSDWLFGDEKTRDRAFFGSYPTALAPLQLITPPSFRLSGPILNGLINDDWEKMGNYYAWTMFPFGRLARDLVGPGGLTDNPYYGIDKLTGIPVVSAKRLSVKEKEKEIKRLKKNLENKTTRLRTKKEALGVVQRAETDKVSTKGTVMSENQFDTLPKKVKTLLEEEKERIVFKPNTGPQTEFLAAGEQDVLYGGAAGGGKSYAMLVDPLRYMHIKEHRALLLRKSMPELRELIDKSRELYPKAFIGAKFREVEKIWRFPSGASLEFGYLDRDADVYRYQGQSYTWIGIDELTQYPTEFPLQYLQSRLRTTNNAIQCYIRCTANPGGVGGSWVKKRYLDPSPPNESFIGQDKITRKFIPAKLDDNPYLAEDGKYERMLESLPPVQKKQLLEGNWDVSEGAAFVEFDYDTHCIDPYELPKRWERFKGIDYGYASESAVIWAALDPQDDTLIVYRELYQKGLTGEDLATKIFEYEKEDKLSVRGVLDSAAWARTGTTGPTVGEALTLAGHKLRRADKNRIQGKIQVHERLKLNSKGRPRLQIFKSCPNLIKELQGIPVDANKPEDVDTKAPDHAYDALRYLIMSRPRTISSYEEMQQIKRWTPSDPTFGY